MSAGRTADGLLRKFEKIVEEFKIGEKFAG